MRYREFKLVEALKPSEYRKLVKGWDKQRYAQIFMNPAFKHDKKGYRVYIPIETPTNSVEKSETHTKIEEFLSTHGYQMIDYIKGIVQDTAKKQQIKIGKVLTKLGRTDLLNEFNVDKTRSGVKSTYIAVISRHPYDLAGMSTDRGWTSCMNLKSGINRHYVPLDIKEGSVIAYVTTTDDLDLKNPVGRVLLKPFVDILGKPVVYFGIENSTYGTAVPGFLDAVKKWADSVNSSHELDDVVILNINPNLYKDSDLASQTVVSGKKVSSSDKEKMKELEDNPRAILDMDNPSESLLVYAVSKRPSILTALFDREGFVPSEAVQRIAVIKEPSFLSSFINKGIKPTESVQLAGVSGDWRNGLIMLKAGIKMSDNVVGKVIDQYAMALPDFIAGGYELSDRLLTRAVRSNIQILDWLEKKEIPVSLEVEKTAIESGYSDFFKIALKYDKSGKRVPDVLVKKALERANPTRSFLSIVRYNKDYPEKQIPVTEKEVALALVKGLKHGEDALYQYITEYESDDPLYKMSPETWTSIVEQTGAKRHMIRYLMKQNIFDSDSYSRFLHINPQLIEHIKNPSLEQQMSAISKDPQTIKYINAPSVKVQIAATKIDPNAAFWIEEPALEALELAASYKEKMKKYNDEDAVLVMSTLISTLIREVESGRLTIDQGNRLIELAIRAEPHRIMDLIRYDSFEFPVTEKLAMIAIPTVSKAVPEMLEYDTNVTTEMVELAIKSHPITAPTIISRVIYSNADIDLPLGLLGDLVESGVVRASWLVQSMPTRKQTPEFVKTVLEAEPEVITTLVAYEIPVTKQQLISSVGAVKETSAITLFNGIEQMFNEVDPDILTAFVNGGKDPGDRYLRAYRVKKWTEGTGAELPKHIAAELE